MDRLHIIHCSTRPARVGFPVTTWFQGVAVRHGKLETRVVDLAEVGLPLFDEPEHPRFGRYVHDHTKRWSAIVAEADAFVFVMAEYNHGMPASFKNAIDYLSKEWMYKPCGFVSYGAISGGTRAVQQAKQVVASVKMTPILEAVILPNFAQHLDAEKKVFAPPELQDKAAVALLDELARWTVAMRSLRS